MINNFRKQPGCFNCKHCVKQIEYGAGELEYYCGLDGIISKDVLYERYGINITREQLEKMEEVISEHRVSSHAICDDWKSK
jgi:hypothetical protein